MGSSDMKQPLPSFAPGKRYLNVGFVAGFLLVFLTYIVVSQQFSITAPNGTRLQTRFLFTVRLVSCLWYYVCP